jgi:hypothetical protein
MDQRYDGATMAPAHRVIHRDTALHDVRKIADYADLVRAMR